VSQLADAQLDALRSLRAAYPDAEIAIIGATALVFHIGANSPFTSPTLAGALAGVDPEHALLAERPSEQELLQRAMNGTVAPSASSRATAATCSGRQRSSCAICAAGSKSSGSAFAVPLRVTASAHGTPSPAAKPRRRARPSA